MPSPKSYLFDFILIQTHCSPDRRLRSYSSLSLTLSNTNTDSMNSMPTSGDTLVFCFHFWVKCGQLLLNFRDQPLALLGCLMVIPIEIKRRGVAWSVWQCSWQRWFDWFHLLLIGASTENKIPILAKGAFCCRRKSQRRPTRVQGAWTWNRLLVSHFWNFSTAKFFLRKMNSNWTGAWTILFWSANIVSSLGHTGGTTLKHWSTG